MSECLSLKTVAVACREVEGLSEDLEGELLIEFVGDQFNACREGVISSRIGRVACNTPYPGDTSRSHRDIDALRKRHCEIARCPDKPGKLVGRQLSLSVGTLVGKPFISFWSRSACSRGIFKS
jgi:hypothetical protein